MSPEKMSPVPFLPLSCPLSSLPFFPLSPVPFLPFLSFRRHSLAQAGHVDSVFRSTPALIDYSQDGRGTVDRTEMGQQAGQPPHPWRKEGPLAPTESSHPVWRTD